MKKLYKQNPYHWIWYNDITNEKENDELLFESTKINRIQPNYIPESKTCS